MPCTAYLPLLCSRLLGWRMIRGPALQLGLQSIVVVGKFFVPLLQLGQGRGRIPKFAA